MLEVDSLNFETHDKLGLQTFCGKLEGFLIVEHRFVEGSLVISLDAPFGGGKSMFLSMWKSDLDQRRKTSPDAPKAIIVNAWDSDFCGDPLLSITNALIKAVGVKNPGEPSDSAVRLREAAKDVGWYVTGLANSFVSHWTGLDPATAGELAEAKKDGRKPKTPDFIALYDERTKALLKLKEALRSAFGGESPSAFVFVDELDRCRPDYAISYLETIKHVFDIHGLVFVLAIDRAQLECSAKALFGADLRFPDYFRKFAQRSVTLPTPDEAGLQRLTQSYVSGFLEKEGTRSCLMQFDQYRTDNVVELFQALKMPPRQIQQAIRIIAHTVAGDTDRRGRLFWAIGVGVILMSVLKVAEPEMYRRIGTGEAHHEDVGKFLIKLLGAKNADWWFCCYLTGTGDSQYQNEWPDLVERLFKSSVSAGNNPHTDRLNHFGQFVQGWGCSDSNRWKQIYQKIESANSF
jgi:hypothetical protein